MDTDLDLEWGFGEDPKAAMSAYDKRLMELGFTSDQIRTQFPQRGQPSSFPMMQADTAQQARQLAVAASQIVPDVRGGLIHVPGIVQGFKPHELGIGPMLPVEIRGLGEVDPEFEMTRRASVEAYQQEEVAARQARLYNVFW